MPFRLAARLLEPGLEDWFLTDFHALADRTTILTNAIPPLVNSSTLPIVPGSRFPYGYAVVPDH